MIQHKVTKKEHNVSWLIRLGQLLVLEFFIEKFKIIVK